MPRESKTNRKKRAAKIFAGLKRQYPTAGIALRHSNPLELLVATILSAQCTDVRVNIVTKDLFKKYRSAGDYARASREQFEQEIRTTGFFRNKAKNIITAAGMLVENFGGKVPDSMDELLKLPGVARKTANVVLGNAFGKNEGFVVDTHIKRLAGRLGFTKHTDPKKIEPDMMALVPRRDWRQAAHLLIFLGRGFCKARKPQCPHCPVERLCPSATKATSRA